MHKVSEGDFASVSNSPNVLLENRETTLGVSAHRQTYRYIFCRGGIISTLNRYVAAGVSFFCISNL